MYNSEDYVLEVTVARGRLSLEEELLQDYTINNDYSCI